VAGADVRIAGNPITEGYVEAILDPETRIAKLRAEAAGNGAPAPARRADALEARIAAIEARLGEVAPDVRRRILASRSELLDGGVPVETYRRVGLDEALRLLCSPAAAAGGLTHRLGT
jgi:hypothetical protein